VIIFNKITKPSHASRPQSPCDLELWPMTLKFNRVLQVVEVHVRTKFYQAKSCGS